MGLVSVCRPVEVLCSLYIESWRQLQASQILRETRAEVLWRCVLPRCDSRLGAGTPQSRLAQARRNRQVARIQRGLARTDANGLVPRYKEAFLVQRGLGSLGAPFDGSIRPVRTDRGECYFFPTSIITGRATRGHEFCLMESRGGG